MTKTKSKSRTRQHDAKRPLAPKEATMPPSMQMPGPRFTPGTLGDWTYEQSLRYEQALCLIDGRIAACNAEIEQASGSAEAAILRAQRLDLLRKRRALHVGDDRAIAELLNQTQHV